MVAGTGTERPSLKAAVVQDADTGHVLMLGWMDEAALAATRESGCVTFFSRSRGRLWRKGETSGNTLALVDIRDDCDGDALLVRARPAGPVCHNGTRTCFGDATCANFLDVLQHRIDERASADAEQSYTARLLRDGLPAIARKVAEEGVEVALAGVVEGDQAVMEESADLMYHLLVLLKARGVRFDAVLRTLATRL